MKYRFSNTERKIYLRKHINVAESFCMPLYTIRAPICEDTRGNRKLNFQYLIREFAISDPRQEPKDFLLSLIAVINIFENFISYSGYSDPRIPLGKSVIEL